MSNAKILPAPDINDQTAGPMSKLETEKRAFRRLLPALLTSHRGLYVAIHGEQVVGSGPDQIEVALEAYRKYGYVPIYVGHVTDQTPAPIRVPSPRLLRRESTQGNA